MVGDALELSRRLVGGRTSTFGWGGRVRVVASDAGPGSRWRAAHAAPANRLPTRLLRAVRALPYAVRPVGLQCRPESLLTARLPDELGRLTPAFAIIGAPSQAQSVVVALQSGTASVAMVKIGATSAAAHSITTETHALSDPAVRGRAPDLLWHGEVEGLPAVATRYVRGRSGSVHAPGLAQARLVLPDAADGAAVPAEVHPWLADVARSGQIPKEFLLRLPGRWPIVRMHGDLAPWNIVVRDDGSCIAVDWEDSVADGFVGVDVAHHVAATRMMIFGDSASDAAGRATHAVARLLSVTVETAAVIVAATAGWVGLRRSSRGAGAAGERWFAVRDDRMRWLDGVAG